MRLVVFGKYFLTLCIGAAITLIAVDYHATRTLAKKNQNDIAQVIAFINGGIKQNLPPAPTAPTEVPAAEEAEVTEEPDV